MSNVTLTPERYRDLAAESLRAAESAPSCADKLYYLEMAADLDLLAGELEHLALTSPRGIANSL